MTPAPAPLWRQLAWFAGLWLASVTALGLVSLAIKAVLRT
jgi:hypothetical protein